MTKLRVAAPVAVDVVSFYLVRVLKTYLRRNRYTAIVLLFGVVSLGYHLAAGMAFPAPWPDEAYFLWQSVGIAENNSLYSEELHPDRHIYWMPPAYMVTVGVVFKAFGVSLELARFVSWLVMLGAFFVLTHFLRRAQHPILTTFSAALIFLSGAVVVASNVARMEAFVILLAVSGLYLLFERRFLYGLCVLALGPLFHPAGVPFLISGVVCVFLLSSRSFHFRRLTLLEIVAVTASVSCWLAYLSYVGADWSSFAADMAYQWNRKAGRHLAPSIYSVDHLLLLTFVTLGVLYARKRQNPVTFLLSIAVPARWVAVSGAEMWYDVYNALAWLCFGLFFVIIVIDAIRQSLALTARGTNALSFALVIVMGLGWCGPGGRLPVNVKDIVVPEWRSMRINGVDYLNEEDIEVVSENVRQYYIARGADSLRLQITPCADAFSYFHLRNEDLKFSTPLFCDRLPDAYVFHRSRRLPQLLNYAKELKQAGVTPETLEPFLIHRRDSTESWYLVPVRR